MLTVFIWIICIALGAVGFVTFGCYDVCVNYMMEYFHQRYRKLRSLQRPSRIFLVRHGQSQANVDTSNHDKFYS